MISKKKDLCPCCINNYNNSYRQELKCEFCENIICNTCSRQYILTKAIPQCMKCHSIWNDDFLFKSFPKSWVDKELRHHIDDILVQHEKSLFPLAIAEIEHDKLEKERKKIQYIRLQLESQLDRINNYIIKKSNINLCRSEQVDLNYKIKEQVEIESKYNDVLNNEIILSDKLAIPVSTKFKRQCPKDACKGYINIIPGENIHLHCVVCKSDFCNRCREFLTTSKHICDESTVKTLKLLDSDSKQCPGCKIHVYKITGCNQMFCTNCHVAFDWNTGNIETGNVHNPHYFDWIANGGNSKIINLDRIRFDISSITEILMTKFSLNIPDDYMPYNITKGYLINIIRTIQHLRNEEITRTVNPTVRHLKSRISFILNEIDEIEWKDSISLDERIYKKLYIKTQIIELICNVLTDIIQKFIEEDTKSIKFVKSDINSLYTHVPDFIVDADNIRKHFNNISRNYSLRFSKTNYLTISYEYYIMNIPTVKDEVPIENFNILCKDVLILFDWMDTLETETITLFIDIKNKIDILMEDIHKNKEDIEWEVKLNDIITVKFVYDLDIKISIRKKRKIRTSILLHALYIFKKQLYSFYKILNIITKTFKFNHSTLGMLEVTPNVYLLLLQYPMMSKNNNILLNDNPLFYQKDTFICKKDDYHYSTIDILLLGVIHHIKVYEFNYISFILYQLYINISNNRFNKEVDKFVIELYYNITNSIQTVDNSIKCYLSNIKSLLYYKTTTELMN